MSDYFGALMRSAGAAVPAGPGGIAAPASAAADDAFEQQVEVDAASPPTHEERDSAPATKRPGEPGVDAAPAPVERRVPVKGSAAAPAPPRVAQPQPAAGPAETGVHPAVRAALRWVAAAPPVGARDDTAAVEGHVVRHIDTAPSESGVARDEPRLTSSSSAVVGPTTVIPAATSATGAVPRTAMPATHAIGRMAPPPAPRAAPVSRMAASARGTVLRDGHDPFEPVARPAPPEAVEVHIGTIHVQVDAPPAPRVVAAPVPPAARPQPVRTAAPSSGFARARLPRL